MRIERYEFFLNDDERAELLSRDVLANGASDRQGIDYCLLTMRSEKPDVAMCVVLPSSAVVDEFGERVFDFSRNPGYVTRVYHESWMAHKIIGSSVDVCPEALGLYSAHRPKWFQDGYDLVRAVVTVGCSFPFVVYVPIRNRLRFLPVTRNAMRSRVELALCQFLVGHIETWGELSLVTYADGLKIDKPFKLLDDAQGDDVG